MRVQICLSILIVSTICDIGGMLSKVHCYLETFSAKVSIIDITQSVYQKLFNQKSLSAHAIRVQIDRSILIVLTICDIGGTLSDTLLPR